MILGYGGVRLVCDRKGMGTPHSFLACSCKGGMAAEIVHFDYP
jgi:hypothetical protein